MTYCPEAISNRKYLKRTSKLFKLKQSLKSNDSYGNIRIFFGRNKKKLETGHSMCKNFKLHMYEHETASNLKKKTFVFHV